MYNVIFFRAQPSTVLAIRQKFSLLNSKGHFVDSRFARFQRLSPSIGRLLTALATMRVRFGRGKDRHCLLCAPLRHYTPPGGHGSAARATKRRALCAMSLARGEARMRRNRSGHGGERADHIRSPRLWEERILENSKPFLPERGVEPERPVGGRAPRVCSRRELGSTSMADKRMADIHTGRARHGFSGAREACCLWGKSRLR